MYSPPETDGLLGPSSVGCAHENAGGVWSDGAVNPSVLSSAVPEVSPPPQISPVPVPSSRQIEIPSGHEPRGAPIFDVEEPEDPPEDVSRTHSLHSVMALASFRPENLRPQDPLPSSQVSRSSRNLNGAGGVGSHRKIDVTGQSFAPFAPLRACQALTFEAFCRRPSAARPAAASALALARLALTHLTIRRRLALPP